jgi:hypothetical protein
VLNFVEKNLKDGGVSNFVHKSLNFTNINVQESGKEQGMKYVQ